MGYNVDYLYVPCLAACACSEIYNLPMLLSGAKEAWEAPYRVVCDFCGNKTRDCSTEEQAELLWNMFQYRKGKKHVSRTL